MERERQTTEFAEHVSAGRMSYSQGERMCTFLDLERLGLVTRYYPKSVLAARRREARLLGLAPNDAGLPDVDVELEHLLTPYREAFEDVPEGEATLAPASGPPPPEAASDNAIRLPDSRQAAE
jgi:hypothetical protein